MAETIIEHVYRLKGGEQLAVEYENPFLERREPIIVYCTDGVTRMKIGDGIHRYNELDWIEVDKDIISSDILVDDNSITNRNSTLQLYNFSEALANQIPHKDTNGKLVWKDICLRRDNDYNYTKLNITPQFGEILLVDTAREGLRIKCGDGVTPYSELSFVDDLYLKGFYKDGKFYVDRTYSTELLSTTNKLYVDLTSNTIYFYNGVSFVCTTNGSNTLPNASATSAGILKLYNTIGTNTDGTMTQAAITDELDDKVEIDVNLDEELLIFTN